MPGSTGQPDAASAGAGTEAAAGITAGGDHSPRPAVPEADEAAPRPPPEPDDAAAALRLALDQLCALGLGGARPRDEDAPAAASAAEHGEPEPVAAAAAAAPNGLEAGAPPAAPGALPLLEPDVSPRPSPPDVFATFAPHPAALGPSTLLAEQLSVIGSRKKSVNMTECVPVPSSEHVAEIVGRQGCKIKALRAKTNTYIKTPVRGEEPVFIVTGRKEDVEMAKREILSAAEHFSLIRATRSKAGGLQGAAPGPPNLPGQTTIQVRVPYRVVGLVVGPKGATIKRIQQRTHTYILTPGRDKEPVFAVTGMPENVDRAREEIEAHITLRTGAFTDTGPDSDFHANGTDVCLDLLGAAANLWAKAPHVGRRPPTASASLQGDAALSAPEAFYASSRGGLPAPEPCPPSPYGAGNGSFTFGGDGPGALAGMAAPEDCDFGFDFLALDLTVPTAATIWAPFERAVPQPTFANGAPAPHSAGIRRSSGPTTTPRHSPTLTKQSTLGLELPLARRGAPDPVGALPWRPSQSALPPYTPAAGFPAPTSLASTASAASSSSTLDAVVSEGSNRKPSSSSCSSSAAAAAIAAAAAASSCAAAVAPGPAPAAALARECVVCAEGEAMAALVPCGHNLFCMDCAVRICGKREPQCPACRTPATQAIHIFS